MLFNSIESVFTIFTMIGIGFFLSLKKIITWDLTNGFAKIIIKVSVPCFILYSVNKNFSLVKEDITNNPTLIFVPILSMVLTMAIGFVLTKGFKIPSNKKGVFISMFGLSNTLFMGLPVTTSILSEKSVPYATIFFISNSLVFWSIAYNLIRSDVIKSDKKFSKNIFRNLINPGIVSFIFTILITVLNIKIPNFILESCKYMGNLTTPLSMIFIGYTLSIVDLKKLKFNFQIFLVALGRFFVSPIVTYFLCKLFGINGFITSIFILQASMPVMAQVTINSREVGGDYENAVITCTITTALSLIFIPIYTLLFSYLHIN